MFFFIRLFFFLFILSTWANRPLQVSQLGQLSLLSLSMSCNQMSALVRP